MGTAEELRLNAALARPTMLLCDQSKCENHLRIALTGFELPNAKKRAPVNVAIVIDRSGSMHGKKIENARNAAIQAVDRLNDQDIVSVVVYATEVEVLIPATRATDRESIKERIRAIRADGNTALHAGVSKGAQELRKFRDDKRVNRVILLSDGLANVGPSSPEELGRLGKSLLKESISVSTMGLGLGYNEDLMSKLAIESSGNHTFIEDAENLVQVFQREFDDVLSVVAQKIEIEAKLASGVRPVKVLNYPASIDGQMVKIDVGQLYSRQERYFVLELEIEKGSAGSTRPVAEVVVNYLNTISETNVRLSQSVDVKFTDSKELAEKSINKEVAASCAIQIANEINCKATEMRDRGDIRGAEEALKKNAAYLAREAEALGGNVELRRRSEMNASQASGIGGAEWNASRKNMRAAQAADAVQQTYSGSGEKQPK